jgi:serine/threonine protein kinase/Tol biopolymer transport system component
VAGPLRSGRQRHRCHQYVASARIIFVTVALASGAKLGPYEIVSRLGTGGMGEVYRARDTRLDRTVAIKILPAHLSSDPIRKQRFEREAKSVSALNHPHICVLYDVGYQDGIDYLVMECLEGETLARRLEKGPLSLDQVLKFGAQIADALDAAHRSSLVHRDLKPANIILTASGAKLLDFGLAKPAAPLASLATLSASKQESPITQEGSIVGTFQYMSPEQIEGGDIDTRSDIFSLGAVLYEMLTAKRAFEGKSQLSVASAILEKEPAPIGSIIATSPPALDHVIQRCLTKNPDQRWQTARDLARELDWIAQQKPGTEAHQPPRRREVIAWGLAALSLLLLSWLGFVRLGRYPTQQRQHLRLSLLPPQSTSFVPNHFAISPDGQRLAFVAAAADGGTALWIRSLSAAAAQQVTGTEGAAFPFWSPDNHEVGFFAGGKLKSVDLSAGSARIICDALAPAGGAWSQQGTIVFFDGSDVSGSGLQKVSAAGGTPRPAVKINTINAVWPSFLPDGDHFLFFVTTGNETAGDGVYVGSLTSMESKLISSEIRGNTLFASGRLFFVRDRSLMIQPFDSDRLQIAGPAEPLAQQELEPDPAFSRAGFSVSSDGIVVFQAASENVSRLQWFDRQGKDLGEIPVPGYRDPAISHDASLLIVSADEAGNGKRYIHIYDFERGTSARLSHGGTEIFPVLSPDGRAVAYRGLDDHGSAQIYVMPTDGSGKSETLPESTGLLQNDWSSDGRYLIYMNFQRPGPRLGFYDFLKHTHSEFVSGVEAQFSPDGKWVAFTGAALRSSTNNDIFVAQFPEAGRRVPISNHGGAQARWRPDGKELFYISNDKKLMAVSIDTSGGKLVAGVPHGLFQTRIIASRIVLFQYAVAPDGKRFLINSLPSVGATPLTILMN